MRSSTDLAPSLRALIICIAATTALIVLPRISAAAEPKSVEEIANYAGADRQQILEAGAKAEGALMVYATGTQIQPLIDRFEQIYPYIKVEMPRADSGDVARKVYEEYNAGLYQVDVFELSSYGLLPLRDENILQPFTSPEGADFAPTAFEAKHRWVSVRESYIGVGYNTKLIPPAEAPKTYKDMLDPKWKGKMAITGELGSVVGWVAAMTLSEGPDFLRDLGKQDMRVYQTTARAIANLMISGEVSISPTSYNSHMEASADAGAPLAWVAPGPVPVTDTSTAIVTKAPHPHAAMLFIDFLMSKEGQQMYLKLGYSPARNGMADPKLPPLQKLYLTNRPNYLQEYDQWAKLAHETVLQGK
jgi:iron(III) transport system substrate-binding protein